MRTTAISAALLLSCILTGSLRSQGLNPDEIARLVERTRTAFDVPGIAVGIVKDGQLIYSGGFGVRSLGSGKPVDEHTLFGIASNSKAFTALALGLLADEGKLGWDDKVVDHLPGFRLYDPYVTQDFTIRDLLTHRSGMGLGAGDLMLWPDGSDFTREEVIHNLRYLKQVSPFRSKYDYDNNLYIVAGEVIAKVSGMSWEDFVQKRILDPLGMAETAPSFVRLKDTSNVIAPHAPVDGTVMIVPRTTGEVMNAAGGLYSNIHDLAYWVAMHLNRGTYGPGQSRRLISLKTHQELWTPQTIMKTNTTPPYNTHFTAYGLGFRLADVKGYLEVSHTGGMAGMVTKITLYPELNLGIIVLTNQLAGGAFTSITNQIADSYLGISDMDWVAKLSGEYRARIGDADKVTAEVWKTIGEQRAAKVPQPDLTLYEGTYTDPWFGDMVIGRKDGAPWIRSVRSPGLNGELIHYRGQTWVARWTDRTLDADAFVLFQLGYDGKAKGMTMKAISPMTDFSYDFHDLNFTRR